MGKATEILNRRKKYGTTYVNAEYDTTKSSSSAADILKNRRINKYREELNSIDINSLYNYNDFGLSEDKKNEYKTTISNYKTALENLKKYDSSIKDEDYNNYLQLVDLLSNKFDVLSSFKTEDEYKTWENSNTYKDYSYFDIQKEIADIEYKMSQTTDKSEAEEYKKRLDWLDAYLPNANTTEDYDIDVLNANKDLAYNLARDKNILQNNLYSKYLDEGKSDAEAKYLARTAPEVEEFNSKLLELGFHSDNIQKELSKAKMLKHKPTEKEVMSKSDFEEKSTYSPTVPRTVEQLKAAGYELNPGSDGDASNPYNYQYVGIGQQFTYTGEDGDLYTYLNSSADSELKGQVERNKRRAGEDYIKDGYHLMEEDEIKVYNYLYNTEGQESAWQYINKLRPTLQKRVLEEDAKKTAALVDESALHAIAGSAMSVGYNLIDSAAFIPKAAATLMGEYENYQWLDTYGNKRDAVRGTVGENLDENVGHLASMGYSGVMSIADMAAAMAIGAGVGGSKETVGKITQAIMSSSAGSSTLSNAKANGRSDGEALALGLGSAAIEWATEKYSVEKLLNNPSSIKSYLWQNFYTEALEEGTSNIANIALDDFISYVGSSKSDIQRDIDALVLNGGFTKEEAGKQVFMQRANAFFEDMAVGGFAGIGMAGGTLGIGAVSVKADEAKLSKQAGIDITDNKRVGELVTSARSTGDAKLMKLAEQVAGVDYSTLPETKKESYAKKVGKLYSRTLKAQGEGYHTASKTTVKGIVTEKLKANGVEESKIDKAADVIVKQIFESDKALTKAETKIFNEVDGTSIFNEIKDDKDVGIEVGKAQTDAFGKYFETASLTEEKNITPVDTSAYDTTDDGKTYVKDTGEEVAITGIASVNKGKMMVNLSNGKTENIKNLDIAADEAIIYQGILDMNVDSSIGQFIAKTFKGSGMDANTYILGVKDAIHYGKIGGKSFLNEGIFTSELTEKMREDFYKLGEKYTRDSVVEKEQTIAKAIASNKGKKSVTGKVSFKGVNRNELNARQKVTVNAIEAAFGTMGIDVVFFNSPVNAEGKHIGKNGSYNPNTNTIELDISAGINAQDTILFTASHELTHFIKEWSPEKFKEFADFLVKQYHAHGVDVDALVKAKMEKFNLDYDTAFEEVVADSCESFLRDSNLMKTLTALAKQDLSLFERVGLFLDGLIEKLNKAYEGLTPDSRESREVLKMKDCIKELHDMWDEAALVARENFQNAGGKKTTSTNVKEQAREYDGNGNEYWQIESEKDIFKGIKNTQGLKNAAYNYILKGDKGNKVAGLIDGKNLEFIRVSAKEYVYGRASQMLSEEEYKQKMRMSTSIIDLIDNAPISYDAPDHKNHKLFPNGFKNYQGRVGIDDTIFRYIVRVGKAKNGMIFYDINLEVDGKVPRANRTSLIKSSTSFNNKISNSKENVKENSEKNSERGTDIGSKSLDDYAEAKTTDGKELFQYRAMENDEDAYRVMLTEHTDMTETEINNLFTTIDKAMDIIKENLEVLDYAWDEDIDDRAFNPVKQNSDKLYKFSVDFSTMCRKRILQQVIIEELQSALDRAVTKSESIAIRNELMKLQEEGRQIEIACALCYVESARMKSPAQIQKFLDDRGDIVRRYFAAKSEGEIKEKITKAEANARKKLAKQYADEIARGDMPDPTEMVGKKTKKFVSLQSLPKKVADEIRNAKRAVIDGYKPNNNEEKLIKIAENLSVEDFTSAKGLENLAKKYPELFDVYTGYVRNATHSKGTEKDVWWRIGDSQKLTDDLIATMNAENGLRTQSWSDFQVMHLLDYIGAIIELSARKAKMQSYTKVPDYVCLMGNTNQMLNLSLIPMAEFNGKLDFDSIEGMEFKRALELRDIYHATAGTISIGINNEQIKMLLESGLIDYVIPYHHSAMSKVVRKQMHIPTWVSYESYQGENTLKTNEALKNAKAYGVKLLPNKDSMWHKSPKFSEWFDIEEARQIAEMENHTPSDLKAQKKYGVMYGAYKAMQNAADNYLKLCAERGLSPKFSHESADFTKEDNYWKLLIDRKMIDNITGEIIEQKPVQAVFDEAEVLRILNDEVARYPKVKEDQDYATRTVVGKFLSGDMSEDVSKIAASILEKPVNNVTKVSILNSADGVTKNSMRDSQGKKLTDEQIEFFKDSKVRDADDNLKVMYHGTPNGDFTIFRIAEGSHNSLMAQYGAGYYFDENKESAKRYTQNINKSGGKINPKVFEVYLDIRNPLEVTDTSHGITKKQFADVISRGNYEWFFTNGMPFDLSRKLKKSKSEIQSLPRNEIINHWVDMIFEEARYTTDILSAMVKAFRGDSIISAMKEVFDNDGIRVNDEYGEMWIAWDANQIKETTNLNPTSDPDIRYSERDYTLNDFTIDDLMKLSDKDFEELFDSVDWGDLFEDDKSSGVYGNDISIDDISEELNVEPQKIEILVHRKGLGTSHIDENRTAVMTQKRIDRSIGDSGAGSNPDYARRYITRISTRDFIDLTVLQKNMDRKTFDSRVEGDLGSTMGDYDYANALRDSKASPYLSIDKTTGQIIGHNGRHRIRALEMSGIESVEIEVEFHDEDGRLIKYNAETIPDMAISSQFDTAIETHISNIIPLNEAYRTDIEKSYGEKAHSNAGVLYQERDPEQIKQLEQVNKLLKTENAKLTEDVERLKELVKLQRTETHNKVLSKSSIDVVAKNLMKYTNAKGDRAELVKHLEDVYSYILQGENVSWEGVMEKAENAVDWLERNEHIKTERDEYANTILKDLRTSRFYLDDLQKKEVAFRYGSYNEFRKKTMGRFILTDNAEMSLDSQWQVWAENYPGKFDASESSNNQPLKLMDIIDGLQEEIPVDYYGDAQMNRQDLLMSVYDGYWNVSTLTTFADRKQKEINNLKYKHKEQMSKLREDHNDKTLQLKKEYNEKLAKVREKSYEKQQAIAKHYQDARKKGIEDRNKTKARGKIKNVVNELDKLLMRGNKDSNVKEDMQDVALAMLKSADAVFSTSFSNKKIVQGDISQMVLTAKEKNLVENYRDALESIDKTKAKIKELNESGTSDSKYLNKLYSNLNNYENLAKLYDNQLEDVFERERIRISKVTVPQALKELADAYKSIQKSEHAYISNVYNSAVAEMLDDLSTDEGMNRPFKEMSLEQLSEVYDAYKMVLTTIRDANKLFAFDKAITVEKLGMNARSEIEKIRTYNRSGLMRDFVKKYGWDALKPIYAFRNIGSDTLENLYRNIRKGEDVWYRDSKEAQLFQIEMKKKYGFNSWDLEKTYHFVSNNGKEFSLTLEQIMSLYALSRREQSLEHLIQGGIVLEDAVEVKESKTGKTYKVNTANTFTFSPDLLNEVTKVVRENENMKGYVESMQEYLTKMGDKGNEVSMKLFGVRLFKEKVYFPIKSSDTYMNFKPEDVGEFKIKNSSFTKSTKKYANNPIVLNSFESVWGDHINDMALYHAFTLPLEDFTRVFNYRTRVDTELGQDAVRGALLNAYGKDAETYIRNLLKDLNGGVRSQNSTGLANKLISLGKKSSVFASASVTVQQPSAIARAFAHINPKYFANLKQFDLVHHNKAWEELKQYAPVAGIKEMGYFDTGLGQSSVDWIMQNNPEGFREGIKAFFSKDSAYRDEILSKAPALADELTWVAIWEATKKEVAETYDKNADDYLDKCGERFTEVIELTQVYDSVFSRSGYMRSKDVAVKMAVAFMAEPTTTMNMVYDSFVQNHRKTGKSNPAKVIPAVVASVFLNALLKALVTSSRDDDEDEAWIEKYLSATANSFVDDINPLTYIPYVKDVWSIFTGYDINRMDMTVIGQFADSIQDVFKDTVPVYKKVTGVIGAASSIFGVPLKNIFRDIEGVFTIAKSFGISPTSYGVGEALLEGFTGKETSLKDRAWNAYKKGDTSTVKQTVNGLVEDKVKSGKTEKEAKSAVRSSFTNTYKEKYLEAVADKDYALMNEIRKFLNATGLYGSLSELDKTLTNWRTNK